MPEFRRDPTVLLDEAPRAGAEVAVRRHARAVLVSAALGVLGLLLFVVFNATRYQWWAPYHWSAVLMVSAIPPLLWGPRVIAAVLMVDAGLWVAAEQLLPEHAMAAVMIWGLMCVSFIVLGMWPVLEKQYIVSKRDLWFRAAATGGIYFGCSIAYAVGALSLRAMGGLHIWFGAIGMLQAVLNSRRILLGPPEAILSPRAFLVRSAASGSDRNIAVTVSPSDSSPQESLDEPLDVPGRGCSKDAIRGGGADGDGGGEGGNDWRDCG